MSLKESESREQLVGGRASTTKLLPTPVTVSGVSFVSTTWLLVTFAVVVALVVAAGAPYWMKNEDPDQLGNLVNSVYLGLYYFCYELPLDPDVYCKDDLSTILDDSCCTTYSDFTNPVNLTIGSTRLEETSLDDLSYLFSASLVYAFAVVMLIVSLVFGVMAYCKPRIRNFSVFAIAFIFQISASEYQLTYSNVTSSLAFPNVDPRDIIKTAVVCVQGATATTTNIGNLLENLLLELCAN